MTLTTTDAVTALDPMFGQMYAATTAHAWAIPQLTDREKTFLCVVADVCQANLGPAFELHVRTGLAHGVSLADIRVLLRFISYDSGYQAALDALGRLAEIEPAGGRTHHDRSGRRTQPAARAGPRATACAGPALRRVLRPAVTDAHAVRPRHAEHP
jgi:alkylhydroperoxidase/carboxymuconolactone decarboxylase family protein YurZ